MSNPSVKEIDGWQFPVVILGDKDTGAAYNASGGGGGGGAVTVADGADTTQGALADAAVAAGAAGSVSAKLRLMTTQLNTLAGSLDGVEGSLTAIDAGQGAAADAAVAAGAAGSVNAKLRLMTTQLNTLAGYLDGVEGLLGTLGTETTLAAAAASLSVLDDWDESDRAKVNLIVGQAGVAANNGAVSATTPRVTLANDSTGVLAAITSSITPGGAAAHLGKAEDAAHTSGDTGVMSLGVRRDADTSAVSTDGDYGSLLLNEIGFLKADAPDGLAFSGTATSAAVLFTVDLLHYQSASVQVTSAGTGGTTITYEGSENNSDWIAVSGLGVGSTASSNAATTSTTATINQFARKARYFRARVSTYGGGTVTVAGTASKTSALTNVALGTLTVIAGGTAAHDAPVSGQPIRIAARAQSANYTAVASGDTADVLCTLVGAMVNKPYSIPEADWNYAAATGGISNTTTAVTVAAAAGAGLRNYVTALQLSSDALGAATEVVIRDGAGGAVLWRGKVSTAGLSPISIPLPSPLKSSANTLLEIATLTATVTGGVFINLQGYIAP